MNTKDNRFAAETVAEIKALDKAIAELENQRARRVEVLKGIAGDVTGKHEVEGGSFIVRENNRYDQNVMTENLLPGQVRRCSVSKLDSATVKRLYPEVYEAAKVNRGVSVTIG